MSGGIADWCFFDLESDHLPDEASPTAVPGEGRGRIVVLAATPFATSEGWAARACAAIAEEWARAGLQAVLMDLGLQNPSLHQVLNLPNNEGVSDAFLYGASVQRVARPALDDSIFFVSAGTATADPEGVLGHRRWNDLAGGFSEADATLLLFLPTDTGGAEKLLSRATDIIFLAGETESPEDHLGPASIKLVSALGPLGSPPGEAAELGGEEEKEMEPALEAALPQEEPDLEVGEEEEAQEGEEKKEEEEEEEETLFGTLSLEGGLQLAEGFEPPASRAETGEEGEVDVEDERDEGEEEEKETPWAQAMEEERGAAEVLPEEIKEEEEEEEATPEEEEPYFADRPTFEEETPFDEATPFEGTTSYEEPTPAPREEEAPESRREPGAEEEPFLSEEPVLPEEPFPDEAPAFPGEPEPTEEVSFPEDDGPREEGPGFHEESAPGEEESPFGEVSFQEEPAAPEEPFFGEEPSLDEAPAFPGEPAPPEEEGFGRDLVHGADFGEAHPEGPRMDTPEPAFSEDGAEAVASPEDLEEAEPPVEVSPEEIPVREPPRRPPTRRPPRRGFPWKVWTVGLLLLALLVAAGGTALGFFSVPGFTFLQGYFGELPEPEMVLEGPQPVEPVLGYSLVLLHYDQGEVADALEMRDALRSRLPDLLFILTPESYQGGEVSYVLMAGPALDRERADGLREPLGEVLTRENPESWEVRNTSRAFFLGESESLQEARDRVAALGEEGIHAYVLHVSYPDGTRAYRVFSGAYEDAQDAQPLQRILRGAGHRDAPLIERRGTLPE